MAFRVRGRAASGASSEPRRSERQLSIWLLLEFDYVANNRIDRGHGLRARPVSIVPLAGSYMRWNALAIKVWPRIAPSELFKCA
jgi:hypothetical protein